MRDGNRNNLLLKYPILYSCHGTLMTEQTNLILFLTADAICAGNVFSGIAHMISVEYLPQSVEYHQINEFSLCRYIHPIAPTSLREYVRGLAHRLHPPGHYDVCSAQHY